MENDGFPSLDDIGGLDPWRSQSNSLNAPVSILDTLPDFTQDFDIFPASDNIAEGPFNESIFEIELNNAPLEGPLLNATWTPPQPIVQTVPSTSGQMLTSAVQNAVMPRGSSVPDLSSMSINSSSPRINPLSSSFHARAIFGDTKPAAPSAPPLSSPVLSSPPLSCSLPSSPLLPSPLLSADRNKAATATYGGMKRSLTAGQLSERAIVGLGRHIPGGGSKVVGALRSEIRRVSTQSEGLQIDTAATTHNTNVKLAQSASREFLGASESTSPLSMASAQIKRRKKLDSQDAGVHSASDTTFALCTTHPDTLAAFTFKSLQASPELDSMAKSARPVSGGAKALMAHHNADSSGESEEELVGTTTVTQHADTRKSRRNTRRERVEELESEIASLITELAQLSKHVWGAWRDASSIPSTRVGHAYLPTCRTTAQIASTTTDTSDGAAALISNPVLDARGGVQDQSAEDALNAKAQLRYTGFSKSSAEAVAVATLGVHAVASLLRQPDEISADVRKVADDKKHSDVRAPHEEATHSRSTRSRRSVGNPLASKGAAELQTLVSTTSANALSDPSDSSFLLPWELFSSSLKRNSKIIEAESGEFEQHLGAKVRATIQQDAEILRDKWLQVVCAPSERHISDNLTSRKVVNEVSSILGQLRQSVDTIKATSHPIALVVAAVSAASQGAPASKASSPRFSARTMTRNASQTRLAAYLSTRIVEDGQSFQLDAGNPDAEVPSAMDIPASFLRTKEAAIQMLADPNSRIWLEDAVSHRESAMGGTERFDDLKASSKTAQAGPRAAVVFKDPELAAELLDVLKLSRSQTEALSALLQPSQRQTFELDKVDAFLRTLSESKGTDASAAAADCPQLSFPIIDSASSAFECESMSADEKSSLKQFVMTNAAAVDALPFPEYPLRRSPSPPAESPTSFSALRQNSSRKSSTGSLTKSRSSTSFPRNTSTSSLGSQGTKPKLGGFPSTSSVPSFEHLQGHHSQSTPSLLASSGDCTVPKVPSQRSLLAALHIQRAHAAMAAAGIPTGSPGSPLGINPIGLPLSPAFTATAQPTVNPAFDVPSLDGHWTAFRLSPGQLVGSGTLGPATALPMAGGNADIDVTDSSGTSRLTSTLIAAAAKNANQTSSPHRKQA